MTNTRTQQRPAQGRNDRALTRIADAKAIQGTHSDPEALKHSMEEASKHFHLVTPGTSVGELPEGFAVALSAVQVDTDNETYDLQGKRGLSKTALQRIAGALGLSWDAQLSRRLDDGSDPHYCHYRAVCTVRQFDGREITLVGEKEMDLREGAAQVEALRQRYQAQLADYRSGRRKYEPKDPTGQIREMRLHILAHAQTKAQLRAIRSLGVRSSYAPEELRKPFVCAKLLFTGRSSNPATQERLSTLAAEAYMGARPALYSAAPSHPPTYAPTAGHRPPPVGSVPSDYDDPDIIDAEAETAPEPSRAAPTEAHDAQPVPMAQAQETAAGAPSSDRGTTQRAGGRGFVIPGGKHKGTPFEEAPDEALRYWEGRFATDLAEGKVEERWIERTKAQLAAVREEIDRREAEANQY